MTIHRPEAISANSRPSGSSSKREREPGQHLDARDQPGRAPASTRRDERQDAAKERRRGDERHRFAQVGRSGGRRRSAAAPAAGTSSAASERFRRHRAAPAAGARPPRDAPPTLNEVSKPKYTQQQRPCSERRSEHRRRRLAARCGARARRAQVRRLDEAPDVGDRDQRARAGSPRRSHHCPRSSAPRIEIPLADEAGGARDADQAEARDHEAERGERHAPAQAREASTSARRRPRAAPRRRAAGRSRPW